MSMPLKMGPRAHRERLRNAAMPAPACNRIPVMRRDPDSANPKDVPQKMAVKALILEEKRHCS